MVQLINEYLQHLILYRWLLLAFTVVLFSVPNLHLVIFFFLFFVSITTSNKLIDIINSLFNWRWNILGNNHIVFIDYNGLIINYWSIINHRFLYLIWLANRINHNLLLLISTILKHQFFLFLIIFRFFHQFCNVSVYVIKIVHRLNLLIIW